MTGTPNNNIMSTPSSKSSRTSSSSKKNKLSPLDKAEKKALRRQCKQEILELHDLFVSWFQGTRSRRDIEASFEDRLNFSFSHVAPNGKMVLGRQGLLDELGNKYGSQKKRVFDIDVFNVRLVWNDDTTCLCSYEHWQKWEHTRNGATQLVQFGRMSSCLLARRSLDTPKEAGTPLISKPLASSNGFKWIQIHETWLEDERPPAGDDLSTAGSLLLGDAETMNNLVSSSPHSPQRKIPEEKVMDDEDDAPVVATKSDEELNPYEKFIRMMDSYKVAAEKNGGGAGEFMPHLPPPSMVADALPAPAATPDSPTPPVLLSVSDAAVVETQAPPATRPSPVEWAIAEAKERVKAGPAACPPPPMFAPASGMMTASPPVTFTAPAPSPFPHLPPSNAVAPNPNAAAGFPHLPPPMFAPASSVSNNNNFPHLPPPPMFAPASAVSAM